MFDPVFVSLIWAVFVFSLLGSLHCAGMCGPFVLLCVGTEEQTVARHISVQAAYHGGRLLSYMLLGVIAGAVGAATNWGGDVLGFQRTAMIVAGLLMVGFGLVMLLRIMGVRIKHMAVPRPLAVVFARGTAAAQRCHPVPRALIIGLFAIFLPCGWLYLFVIWAAGTGSPLVGAALMASFWAGTTPILAAVGVGVKSILSPVRRHLPAIMACLLMLVGGVVVVRASEVNAHAALPTVGEGETSVQAALDRVRHEEESEEGYVPPCCGGGEPAEEDSAGETPAVPPCCAGKQGEGKAEAAAPCCGGGEKEGAEASSCCGDKESTEDPDVPPCCKGEEDAGK